MSEERIRRSSRIKQLPARFRDDDTRARPSSPNRITSNDTPSAQSQRTRRIPPEALSSSPLFLSSRKINTNKDDQIPHEGRAFTAQTDKPGQGASLNTGLVPGLSAGLSAGLIPGLSVDYISGLSAGSSTTESFTSHNTGQPIPTHLVTSPKMPASIPYLVVAQAYWEQNQQQWADPKRRKAMMLLPGVKEWNQKWVSSFHKPADYHHPLLNNLRSETPNLTIEDSSLKVKICPTTFPTVSQKPTSTGMGKLNPRLFLMGRTTLDLLSPCFAISFRKSRP